MGTGLDIVAELGSSQTSTMFAARERHSGKRLALKVLKPGLAHERVELFLGEARTVARLRHRGIASMRDFGVLPDGRRYVVSELLAGRSLDRLLSEQGRVSVQTALAWTIQLLEALDVAHSAGVSHGDLKPSNIFAVEEKGTPTHLKVLDFGAARLGNTADAAYLAPEQARSQQSSPAGDLYGLGCVLFELISGRRPADPSERLSQHLPGVPQPLEHFVAWLMHRDARQRPRSANRALRHLYALCELFPRNAAARRRTAVTQVHVPAARPEAIATVEQQPTLVQGCDAAVTQKVQSQAPRKKKTSRLGAAALFMLLFVGGACGGVWFSMPPEARAQALEQVRARL